MLSKNQIKHIASLRMQKFREESRQFVAEGHKLVTELVNSRFQVIGIYATIAWISANNAFLNTVKVPISEISETEMQRISSLSTPSQVLAVVQIPDMSPNSITNPQFSSGTSDNFGLALDDVRDPGNMGTIIRIADWFGISSIWCSETCVDVYNPKVVQATMGSIARVSIWYCNLAEEIRTYVTNAAGQVYGTFLNGESIYQIDPPAPGLLVIGNESRGISPEVERLVTKRISIPSYGISSGGKAESLNASVATAIICAEFRRKVQPSICI